MSSPKTGRNDFCPCGSGKKYKQCCMQNSTVSQQSQQPMDMQIYQAMRHAWMLQSAGRNAEAEAVCKQIFSVRPNFPEALHLLGVVALKDGNIEVAITALSKAIQGNNQNPQYHSNLGLAFHEQGKLDLAAKHYRQALKLRPDYIDAYYNLHALQLDSENLNAAIDNLERLLRINSIDLDARFVLGVLFEYRGDQDAAKKHIAAVEAGPQLYRSRVDAWEYLKSSCKGLPRITGSNIQTFQLAINAATVEGLVLEFGVRHGNTIRQIAGLVKQEVHGFDSFEGLPEEWHHEPKGSYTTKGKIPAVPSDVKLHVGWFEDTLPIFLENHDGPVRLVNIDCDIYSSTKTVLDALAPRIVSGTVIIFDEYIGNEHWRQDEYKAFQEAVSQYGWQYEYLSFSFFTKQVTVRIK